MEKKIQNDYSSDMKFGFGFVQVQNYDPFQNFLKKIEVDEENNKLYLTFTRMQQSPLIIDFSNKKMTLPSHREKNFDKFMTVTFEYCREKKAIVLKTFNYQKGVLKKGLKYINVDDLQKVKLTNFLNIYSDNYFKTSKKLIDNDADYVFPIPDFYKKCVLQNKS